MVLDLQWYQILLKSLPLTYWVDPPVLVGTKIHSPNYVIYPGKT